MEPRIVSFRVSVSLAPYNNINIITITIYKGCEVWRRYFITAFLAKPVCRSDDDTTPWYIFIFVYADDNVIQRKIFFLWHYRKKIGLSWWLSGKESAYQCRRLRLDPCIGKIAWRRKWQPTLVLLPGKSNRQRSLVGYSPWGRKESDKIEGIHCHFTSDT